MTNVPDSIASAAEKVTIAGSAGSLLGWANSSEFGMWAGIVIGLIGLVVNWYFKRKSDIRNQQVHDAYLAKLAASLPVAPAETAE